MHGTASGRTRLVAEGDVLAGRYRIERLLHTGSAAHVWSATSVATGAHVAVKVSRVGGADDAATLARCRQEGRALAHVHHPNVVHLFETLTLDDQMSSLVMELLVGTDLQSHLDERGVLPVDHAIAHAIQICRAVEAAHAAGVVHRDVRPANLFLVSSGGVPILKLFDFGAAQIVSSEDATPSTHFIGSPFYASPEQIQTDGTVDSRCDVWAIGVVLYRMIVGRTPFSGRTVPELRTSVLEAVPAAPSEVRAEVQLDLERVILRCLAKDADGRFARALDVAAALETCQP